MALVIVESPAKCKKIEEFLGPGYTCIASFGHFRELPDLKHITSEFKPSFITSDSKQTQVKRLQREINKATEVIIATDDDREGEGIGWHICDHFNLPIPTTKRIVFNEITKSAILEAMKHPTTLNMNLVMAQQARQMLDLFVGFKVSPILWQNISRKKGLSAGRCQSPALRLIYENQKLIDESPGTTSYNTVAYFTKHTIPFALAHNFSEREDVETFLEETVNHEHFLKYDGERSITKRQPNPFTTSKLQQQANNEMRISPKETMSLCQKLYEAGLITYMRTDSTKYSKEFIETAKTYISKTWKSEYINAEIDSLTDGAKRAAAKSKKAKENDAKTKNAQEAHEAIRPTKIERLEANADMSPKEKRLYKLIWCNTVESCMEPAKYKSYTAKIMGARNKEFRTTQETNIFPGWKIVKGQLGNSEFYNYLREIDPKRELNYKKVSANYTLKDLKTHYTEAKLVELLEKNGIGRPSTFSSLVEKIQDRGYVKRESVKGKRIKCYNFELVDAEIEERCEEKEFGNETGKLVIQPTGLLVIEFLIKHFKDIVDYKYTEEMEQTLDLIAKGEKNSNELCRKCVGDLEDVIKLIKSTENAVVSNPGIKIDEHHKYIIGKYGPVIKQKIGENVKFIPVKTDIDMAKLERGEYEISDLIDHAANGGGRLLGKHHGKDIHLKRGKYGLFVTWNGKNRSMSAINKSDDEITLEDVVEVLVKGASNLDKNGVVSNYGEKKQGIVRILTDDMSIRMGKYGHYIFYKSEKMSKPRFMNFKDYKGDYMKDEIEKVTDWIDSKYFS
jgi:DNA topoisomerase I